ncbi:hypothetical protein GCM10022286_05510 [Gryllotalpicola daejeonensis]|uniref:Uncharacterized protein n=1 Tax=Gryllotalpicola daejeonensis TaxID=993087 RepID=A0ABP7ZF62_9MICO
MLFAVTRRYARLGRARRRLRLKRNGNTIVSWDAGRRNIVRGDGYGHTVIGGWAGNRLCHQASLR